MNARALRSAALLAAFVAVAAPATLTVQRDALAVELPPPSAPVRFVLEVDGLTSMTFTEASGGSLTSDATPFKAGQRRPIAPAEQKAVTVTLRAPVNGATWQQLQQWAQNAKARVKAAATLTAFDATGKPTARYVLLGVLPTKVETSQMKAGENQITIMTLVLSAESMKRAS